MHYSALTLLQKRQVDSIEHQPFLINFHIWCTKDCHLATCCFSHFKKVVDKLVYCLIVLADKLEYCLAPIQESVEEVVHHLDHH